MVSLQSVYLVVTNSIDSEVTSARFVINILLYCSEKAAVKSNSPVNFAERF